MADLILKNANIYTMDDADNVCESVVIENGRIKATGNWSDLSSMVGDNTKVIDLGGKTVVPGFIDAHQHIVSFGFNQLFVDCNTTSIKEMVEAVERKASKLDTQEWIIGFGFNEANFKEGRLPNKTDFEHIKNPIYITRFCLHTAIVNDSALTISGILNDSEVSLDENTLNGILREKDMDLVRNIIPPYTKEQIKEAISLACKRYISEGITSVHEAGMGFYTNSLNEFFALKEMAEEGLLDIRVYGMILEEFWDQMSEENLLTPDFKNDFFKLGSIKMFSDGTLSGQTAAVEEDYVYPAGTKGTFMYEQEDLEKKVMRAHKAGKQLAIHAIGDAAVKQVLGAYEKAIDLYPRDDHRHRIEHCGISNETILKRMKEANVIPVPHPGIVYVAGDTYKKVLTPKVLRGLYNTKSFIEAGLQPAFSTDCPVVPSSPFFSMYAALTRETISGEKIIPEEVITVYEAVTMYTKNAARAAFSENEQGSITLGKYADMVVLPENFMDFTPEEIRQTKVEMTIIGGEIKYNFKESTTLQSQEIFNA